MITDELRSILNLPKEWEGDDWEKATRLPDNSAEKAEQRAEIRRQTFKFLIQGKEVEKVAPEVSGFNWKEASPDKLRKMYGGGDV